MPRRFLLSAEHMKSGRLPIEQAAAEVVIREDCLGLSLHILED